jgi:protoporphyrinogen oxidase
MSSKKTNAIIGAGVSGLQAARTILTHPNADSYNVIVFEARNRIGGRAHTNWRWGFPLDYGFYHRGQRLTGKVPILFMERKATR